MCVQQLTSLYMWGGKRSLLHFHTPESTRYCISIYVYFATYQGFLILCSLNMPEHATDLIIYHFLVNVLTHFAPYICCQTLSTLGVVHFGFKRDTVGEGQMLIHWLQLWLWVQTWWSVGAFLCFLSFRFFFLVPSQSIHMHLWLFLCVIPAVINWHPVWVARLSMSDVSMDRLQLTAPLCIMKQV